MRLRNVRGAREALEESDYTINVPEEIKADGMRFSATTTKSILKSERAKADLSWSLRQTTLISITLE